MKRPGLPVHLTIHQVFDESAPMFPKPVFFPGCTLNFAENLLFPSCNPDPESLAIIAATETKREVITWADLRRHVAVAAAAMRRAGVKQGDRVAGYVANHANTVIAMLAATSMGALWTGVSPDTGVHAVLDRLKQVEPVLLFADNAAFYNGKTHETHSKISQIASELPSVKDLVILDTVSSHAFDMATLSTCPGAKVHSFEEFTIGLTSEEALKFVALPPDHPVYILYSSGTTGAPKPIVHAALGTLLQHKKEHTLQCDIRPGEKVFYFTTCEAFHVPYLTLLADMLRYLDDVALVSLGFGIWSHHCPLRWLARPALQGNEYATAHR